MPAAAAAVKPSLMDDTEFLDELHKLDLGPAGGATDATFSASVEGLDQGMVSDEHDYDSEDTADWEQRPTFSASDSDEADAGDRVEQPAASKPNVGRTALGVAGFLLMMCVGGAAAILVFHDRVAMILP